MTGTLWVIGAFLLALGLIIVVHEFGHYAAARLCNVKILRFSVGFGKPLWRRRLGRDGTEWQLAAFPLGGYVKMLDEHEGEVAAAERERAFNRQSVGRRSFIVAAGPAANFILAIVLYWLLFVHGVAEPRAVLDAPPPETPAAAAKVGAGETVRAVSGTPVAGWGELRWEVLRRVLEREEIVLETVDERGNLAFHRLETRHLEMDALDGDPVRAIGLHLRPPALPAVLGTVQAGSPAAVAGLLPGDHVVAIDGEEIGHWHELARGIRAADARGLEIEILREGRPRLFRVVPERAEGPDGRPVNRIGVSAQDDPRLRAEALVTVRYGAIESFGRAVRQTWDTSVLTVRMLGRMLIGELSPRNISGPVTIADYAGQSARMGLEHYLRFLALISISIGVLNLLPIPILDGGHLMYYLAEIVKGRPLSERTMVIGQQVGLTLLILLMALAFYNDIHRLLSG